MIYISEPFYFTRSRQSDVDCRKAIMITALAVGEFCSCYRAELIVPRKGVKRVIKMGVLPIDPDKKSRFIKKLIQEIFRNSISFDLFTLFLDTMPLGNKWDDHTRAPAKFDHHDDTWSWVINLTIDEFYHVKQSWRENNLPEDLFYREDQVICQVAQPGPINRLLSHVGLGWQVKKCFSPKEFEIEQKKPLLKSFY